MILLLQLQALYDVLLLILSFAIGVLFGDWRRIGVRVDRVEGGFIAGVGVGAIAKHQIGSWQ